MKFQFQNNKILLWRLGPINSQTQKHFGKNGHQPPVSRGIWCFPYPYYDLFFVYHIWKKKLPKKYQDETLIKLYGRNNINYDEKEVERVFNEQEEVLKKIIKQNKPSKFYYDGPFYSHIRFDNYVNYDEWFYWESGWRDWAKLANKNLILFEKYNGKLYKMTYAKDHLELFLPNY